MSFELEQKVYDELAEKLQDYNTTLSNDQLSEVLVNLSSKVLTDYYDNSGMSRVIDLIGKQLFRLIGEAVDDCQWNALDVYLSIGDLAAKAAGQDYPQPELSIQDKAQHLMNMAVIMLKQELSNDNDVSRTIINMLGEALYN